MNSLLKYRLKKVFENDQKQPNEERLSRIAQSLGLDVSEEKQQSQPILWQWVSASTAVAAAVIALMLVFYQPTNSMNNTQTPTEEFYKVTFSTPAQNEDAGDLFAIIDDKDIEDILINLNETQIEEILNHIHKYK